MGCAGSKGTATVPQGTAPAAKNGTTAAKSTKPAAAPAPKPKETSEPVTEAKPEEEPKPAPSTEEPKPAKEDVQTTQEPEQEKQPESIQKEENSGQTRDTSPSQTEQPKLDRTTDLGNDSTKAAENIENITSPKNEEAHTSDNDNSEQCDSSSEANKSDTESTEDSRNLNDNVSKADICGNVTPDETRASQVSDSVADDRVPVDSEKDADLSSSDRDKEKNSSEGVRNGENIIVGTELSENDTKNDISTVTTQNTENEESTGKKEYLSKFEKEKVSDFIADDQVLVDSKKDVDLSSSVRDEGKNSSDQPTNNTSEHSNDTGSDTSGKVSDSNKEQSFGNIQSAQEDTQVIDCTADTTTEVKTNRASIADDHVMAEIGEDTDIDKEVSSVQDVDTLCDKEHATDYTLEQGKHAEPKMSEKLSDIKMEQQFENIQSAPNDSQVIACTDASTPKVEAETNRAGEIGDPNVDIRDKTDGRKTEPEPTQVVEITDTTEKKENLSEIKTDQGAPLDRMEKNVQEQETEKIDVAEQVESEKKTIQVEIGDSGGVDSWAAIPDNTGNQGAEKTGEDHIGIAAKLDEDDRDLVPTQLDSETNAKKEDTADIKTEDEKCDKNGDTTEESDLKNNQIDAASPYVIANDESQGSADMALEEKAQEQVAITPVIAEPVQTEESQNNDTIADDDSSTAANEAQMADNAENQQAISSEESQPRQKNELLTIEEPSSVEKAETANKPPEANVAPAQETSEVGDSKHIDDKTENLTNQLTETTLTENAELQDTKETETVAESNELTVQDLARDNGSQENESLQRKHDEISQPAEKDTELKNKEDLEEPKPAPEPAAEEKPKEEAKPEEAPAAETAPAESEPAAPAEQEPSAPPADDAPAAEGGDAPAEGGGE